MRKMESTTPLRADLQRDIERKLLSESSKQTFPTSPILRALDDMLIKPKRIGAFLKIHRVTVAEWLTGRRAIPHKYEDKLLILLRDAVHAGRKACRDAEIGKTLWKGHPFPEEVIRAMRSRIDAAERVLKAHEKSQ